MELSLDPGVTLEPGRCTALIAPPGYLVDLLAQPEIDRFAALYLYGVSSRVLHRLPRQAPRLSTQSCMTVHQLLVSLREAYQTIVIVEYDDGIFEPLEGEDRDVIFAVGRALRELVRSAAVLVWAPKADRGFRALLRTADQVVWRYDERPAASAVPPRRRRPVQRTLAEAGWAGSS
ncbi:MAG TPA: hypothetical protein HA263_05700 [Methanoregulaceae archaeon]|nr:hypothetical protein [Methanoregulaceae archaeon]